MKLTKHVDAYSINDFIKLYGGGWEMTIFDNCLDELEQFYLELWCGDTFLEIRRQDHKWVIRELENQDVK